MKKLLIILLFAWTLTSCVSTKTARNIDKAEDKIVLFNKGINNQIERYPNLIEGAFTTIVQDTVIIPSDTLQVDLALQDVEVADNLAEELTVVTEDAFSEVNEALDIVIRDNPATERRLNVVKQLLADYRIKADTLFRKYVSATKLNNQFGYMETDEWEVPWKIVNGELQLEVRTKPDYVIVDKTVTTNSIDIRKNFWQDRKFWFLFIIPVMAVIYLIGDKLQLIMKSSVGAIIKLGRKIITGGI